MKRVWKYPIPVTDEFTISAPAGAKALTVQAQAGEPCLWALVDPDEPRIDYSFRTFGTGNPVPDEFGVDGYIGSYQMMGGALVFHVFEVTP